MIDTEAHNILSYDAYQDGLGNGHTYRWKPPFWVRRAEAWSAGGAVAFRQYHRDISLAKTRMVTFLVVDSYSAYNAIIGRPALNLFQAIVSTYHMKLKFAVGEKEGEALGNIQASRKCYVEAVRKGEQKKTKRKVAELDRETKPIKIRKKEKEEPDLLSVRPEEELMNIELIPEEPGKTTRVGTQLSPELTEEVIGFLRRNIDVFAWSAGDLLGVEGVRDKKDRMKRYVSMIEGMVKSFTFFKLEQIPREENVKADHLAKIASSADNCCTRKITILFEGASGIEMEVLEIDNGDDWRFSLFQYLSKARLPGDKRKAARVQARAMRFCIVGDLLYKRTFEGSMLRCLSEEEG
ncbi:hypothetical protein DH2020_003936 [Rehmannia glutinosa]|uniref:RNase H type-1 domain-containing protein n=1 Tax=Rehmannia glutinosa TaxID=99300 RepID=A0ABR0XN37_REHGL